MNRFGPLRRTLTSKNCGSCYKEKRPKLGRGKNSPASCFPPTTPRLPRQASSKLSTVKICILRSVRLESLPCVTLKALRKFSTSSNENKSEPMPRKAFLLGCKRNWQNPDRQRHRAERTVTST